MTVQTLPRATAVRYRSPAEIAALDVHEPMSWAEHVLWIDQHMGALERRLQEMSPAELAGFVRNVDGTGTAELADRNAHA